MVNINVICHDGATYPTEIEEYDPVKIAAMINDESKSVIAIGDVIVHRTNVSRVVKAD